MSSSISKVKFVEVRGHRIAYREAGNESGLPVVLIHAFASQSTSWAMIGEHLAKNGFRVVAFDLPGHGQSGWMTHYSLASMEDQIALALDQLNLDRFDLVGHSLGAHLALRLATRMPNRVRRLVVEAAPVPPKDEADGEAIARNQARPSLWRSIRLLGPFRLIRIALFRQFDFKATKPIFAELRKPMPQWWLGLKQIQSPCLVLTSPSDGMIASRTDLLVAGIHNAEVKKFGAGHHLHTDHREAFLDAVMPFLTGPDHDVEYSSRRTDFGCR